MKVAIIAGPFVPVPPTKYGGIELVIHYLIKGLLEFGHEPILLAPGDSTAPCEILPITEKSLTFARTKRELKAQQSQITAANRKTAYYLRKLIGTVDVVHSHGYDMKRYHSRIPCITTLHNSMLIENIAFYQKRRELFFAAISHNQQQTFPDLRYVDVIYNGEDPDDFPLVTEPERYFTFLGRFDRSKNPHEALRLAISLGVKIKLAGKIDHEGDGYFQDEVEPLLKHPLAEYLGEIDTSQKTELLSKAALNLHPAGFREPFGLTVLEAAYCGTPTLAINRGSMPELVENGRTGVLVEDFAEGYHYIEACLAMDRSYISARARSRFNYTTMTEQYISAYEYVKRNFKRKNPLFEFLGAAKGPPVNFKDIWGLKKPKKKDKV